MLLGMALAAALAAPALGANATPANSASLARKYDALKAQMAQMAQQMAAMQKQMAAMKQQQAQQSAAEAKMTEAATKAQVRRLYKRVMRESERISELNPGNIRVLVAGDANVQFIHKAGSASTFYADASPLIQVRVDKRIFINTGFDFYTANGAAGGAAASSTSLSNPGTPADTATTSTTVTGVDMGAANLNYELNDYLTLGGGLISSPIGGVVGIFNPAPWNRWMVDGSLEDNLLPPNELGVWTRGGVPMPDKLGYLTYFLFVSNGPQLVSTAGTPNTLSYSNNNPAAQNGKTVGGRVSYLPIPNVEFGYSFEWARPSPDGALQTANSLVQAIDCNLYYVNKKIDGLARFRGGWTWDQVDQGGVDGAADLGSLSNGGQLEAAYQPSMCGIKYLDKTMVALRYDYIHGPASVANSGALQEQRWSVGLDYWLHSNAVLKLEYEFDNLSGGDHGNDALFMQFAVGI